MIEGIAFYLEGTVVDVEAAHHEGHIATAKEFGVHLTLDEALSKIPHFIGGPDDKVCEDILNLIVLENRNGMTAKDILVRDKFHYERLLATMEICPRPGFNKFFETMRVSGLRMAIGSLTATNQAMILLDRSGLRKLFRESNIILREHVAQVKPAPDVFLKTAAVMGISPKNQLVFEDSPRGVQAAIAAGSSFIFGMPVYNRTETVQPLFNAGARGVFLDWEAAQLIAELIL